MLSTNGIDPILVIIVAVLLYACFMRSVYLYIKQCISNETKFEKLINIAVRTNAPVGPNSSMVVEPTGEFKYSLVIKCRTNNIDQIVRNIQSVRSTLENHPLDEYKNEVILIIPTNAPLIKKYEQINIKVKDCRYLISNFDDESLVKRIVAMARGEIIIDSDFLNSEIENLAQYGKEFMVFAKPDCKCSIVGYNPLYFTKLIATTKTAGMMIFSRLHLEGKASVREMILLSQSFKFGTFIKSYPICQESELGVIEILYFALIERILKLLYSSKVWTANYNPPKINC